jgi:hypothetical protein
MGQESLVNEQIEAGEEFLRDFNDSIAGLAINGAYIYPPITAPSSAP